MAKTIDINIINPFIEATLECLTQMTGLNPVRSSLYAKKTQRMFGDVSGIIGMTGGITGSCTVSFTNSLAAKIVESFLGESCEGNTELIADGIGEVANMVAGGAKRRFSDKDVASSFDLSTPIVLLGSEDLDLYDPTGTMAICCEFLAEEGSDDTFLVEVAVKK